MSETTSEPSNLEDWNELDADQLRALGLVVFWAGRVEIELNDLASELIAPGEENFNPDPKADVVVMGMASGAMLDLAGRLNRLLDSNEVRTVVDASLRQARIALELRNNLVHGTWLSNGSAGGANVLTRKRTGTSLSEPMGASEIIEVASTLADAQMALFKALLAVREVNMH